MNAWIHRDKFCGQIGITFHVFEGWTRSDRQDNPLIKGVHYAVIGKQTLVNVEAVNEWIDQKASGQLGLGQRKTERVSESRFSKKANASTRKRSNVTRIPPLTLKPQ